MNRLPDWPQKLSDYLAANRGIPFKWGRNDCGLFSAGAVLAITGVDPLGPLRGRWTSRAGAMRVIRQFGSLQATVTSLLGQPHAILTRVQRGDIALVQGQDRVWLGVVTGTTITSCENTNVPLQDALVIWKI